jgi:hypothetical protein
MYEKGLRNKTGKKVTISGLSTILHNPFYIGIIRIEKTGEMFAGKHKPTISKALFDQVQVVFEDKNIPKSEKHFFIFRRQIYCSKCQNLYIAEKQKGEIYYRCHTRGCTKGTVRDDLINSEVLKFLKPLELTDLEYKFFKQETFKQSENSEAEFEANYRRLQLLHEQTTDRLSKLVDAYVDGVFDKETYVSKKNELVLEEQSLKEKLSNRKVNSDEANKKLDAFLELVNSACLSYQSGTPEQKQELVKTVFSKCEIEGKNVFVKPYLPFQLIAERPVFAAGSPKREAARTLAPLFEKLFKYFQELDISKNDNNFTNYITSKTEKKSRNNFL